MAVWSMQRVTARLLTALMMAAVLLLGLLPATSEAQACDNTPLLRASNVNQGLPHASLVRSKEILARFYLSKPACSGTTEVSITSASLTVTGGSGSGEPLNLNTFSLTDPAPVQAYEQVFDDVTGGLLAPDASSHPFFSVPASRVTSEGSGAFSLSFSLTVGYKVGKNSPVATSFTAATATVVDATKPLRVLTVPMGDPTAERSTQFSQTAFDQTVAGFHSLNRIAPVADGVADVGSQTGGVRTAWSPGMVDISPYMNPTFCGNIGNLSVVAAQLANFMLVHNGSNLPANRVEKVMGSVDENIASPDCAEGMAVVNGSESWTQAIAPKPELNLNSRTGAVMAMELAHNYSMVPQERDDPYGPIHTQYRAADNAYSAEYTDRGYDLINNAFLSDDRNVLRTFNPDGKWDNYATLLDRLDWPMFLCKLGGPVTNDCSSTAAAPSAIAQATAVIVGVTDGTATGTEVNDSFVGEGPVDEPVESSAVRLVQRLGAGGAILSDLGVRTHEVGSVHDHGTANGTGAHDKSTFAIAFPSVPESTRLELWQGQPGSGTLLYARDRNNAPAISTATFTRTGGGPIRICGVDELCGPRDLEDESSFSAEATRITFEDLAVGTMVSGQYSDQGVTFVDGPSNDPRIAGDCAADGPPCRSLNAFGSSGSTHSPTHSLVNFCSNTDPGCSTPLTIGFSAPQQRVGMYIGNDDSGTTVATLRAFDVDGNLIATSNPRIGFGNDVQEFVGLDVGSNRIAEVRLDYGVDSGLAEDIDDLLFEGDPAPTGSTYRATVTATDETAEDLRAEFLASCPGINVPLAVGVKPTLARSGTAVFDRSFDLSDVCTNGGQATIVVKVNDGFLQSENVERTVDVEDGAPTAVISSPSTSSTILEHDAISLSGLARDDSDGALEGASLEWFVAGPHATEGSVGHGNDVVLAAPATGWEPGDHSIRLVATDSGGRTSEVTSSLAVLKDEDNDGVSEAEEACSGGSDTDPFDSYADGDGDGIANGADLEPCVAKTSFDGSADFDPDTLNVPSSGVPVTMYVRVPGRDLAEIQASTVRITEIGSRDVSDNPAFVATSWRMEAPGVAAAKFDRLALSTFLHQTGATNQLVRIAIGGSSVLPAWSFSAADVVNVKGQ